jgi:oligopeptide transport system ATP-binding protein
MSEPVLNLRDVCVSFDTGRGRLQAVRGADLNLYPGETLALVGESGSGKSALARAILRLNQPPFTPNRTHVEGRITLCRDGRTTELAGANGATLRKVRANAVAMIAQESLSGLNPVGRIGSQIAEALRAASPGVTRQAADAAVLQVLEAVDLPDPPGIARRYPHQLSGGQRQRVMIAISVIRAPAVMIADEPTTALDVTVQARILRLLADLRLRSDMAMLFISHDLAVVVQIADRVAVMYAGQIVEIATVADFVAGPRHPYAAALLAMQPGRSSEADRLTRLKGNAPDPFARSQGCAFRDRCPAASQICAEAPAWSGSHRDGHRCWSPRR